MFNLVSKSTHDAALDRAARAEHDAATARLTLKQSKQNNERLFTANMALAKEVERLRGELATTYVRNSLGRMQKHPSAAPVKLTVVGGDEAA